MSRRPRLSLSSDRTIEKKPVDGFEAAVAVETPATAQSAEEQSPINVGAEDSVSEDSAAAARTAAWPVDRRFLKAAVIVIAAALSLYLLKRRLL